MSQRLNRRKIDLIPEPEWADPPKARIGELLAAVEAAAATRPASTASPRPSSSRRRAAREAGLPDAARHERREARRDRPHRQVRLGPLGLRRALAARHRPRLGARRRRRVRPARRGAGQRLVPARARRPRAPTAVSVGAEPTGVAAGVLALGGGPRRFLGAARGPARAPPSAATSRSSTATRPGRSPSTASTRSSSACTSRCSRSPTAGSARAAARSDRHRRRPASSRRRLRRRRRRDRAAPVPSGRGSPRRSADDRGARTLDLRTGLLEQRLARRRDARRSASRRSRGRARWRSAPRAPLARALARVAVRATGRRVGADARGSRARPASTARRAWPLPANATTGRFERLGAYSRPGRGARRRARARGLRRGSAPASSGCSREHREAWARRWDERRRRRSKATTSCSCAVRFALFHLMALRRRSRRGGRRRPRAHRPRLPRARVLGQRRLRAAVPRRDAPGGGARDARVPDPPAARGARGGTARSAAPARASRGSRRATGATSRPSRARDPTGELVRDPHGRARGAHRRRRRLGRALLRRLDRRRRRSPTGAGRELLVETARYWASRVRVDRDGRRTHLRRDRPGRVPRARRRQRVHERDGALEPPAGRRRCERRSTDRDERDALAASSPTRSSTATTRDTRLYEQFAGFFELEPLVIAEVAPRRPIAADLLLGAERVARRAGRQAGRRADAPPPRPRRGRAGLARRRTSTSTSRAPRTAARCRRRSTPRCSPARAATTRALEALRDRGPDRPRRPHRHDRRRAAPRDDGRRLAGARLRLRRAPARRRRAPSRAEPSAGLGRLDHPAPLTAAAS